VPDGKLLRPEWLHPPGKRVRFYTTPFVFVPGGEEYPEFILTEKQGRTREMA